MFDYSPIFLLAPTFTLATALASFIGGLGLGAFLAASHRFVPIFHTRWLAFSAMLVVGYSFILPIAVARVVEDTENLPRWFGMLLLWTIFAAATAISHVATARRRN